MMPGYMPTPHALGLKAVAVFPGNHGTKYDSHQGIVLLFDVENGSPMAILDASEVTAIRTAAVVRSRLFVDRIESTVNEAGDFLSQKVEDLAATDFVYHAAKRDGVGTWVDLGGVKSATA